MTALLTRPTAPPAARTRTWTATVAVVTVLVLAVDQLAKAWAWRSMSDVHINSGGNPFSGATIGGLLSGRTSGAVFDVVNAGVLLAVAWLLARFSPTRGVALSGAAALAGWGSNLGDRLGLHYVTAPGSVRGVVDFIPSAGHYWNLADGVIALGTTAFVVALLVAAGRVPAPRRRRPPVSAWLPVAVAVVLVAACVLAVVGATSGGYLDGPTSLAAASWSR